MYLRVQNTRYISFDETRMERLWISNLISLCGLSQMLELVIWGARRSCRTLGVL